MSVSVSCKMEWQSESIELCRTSEPAGTSGEIKPNPLILQLRKWRPQRSSVFAWSHTASGRTATKVQFSCLSVQCSISYSTVIFSFLMESSVNIQDVIDHWPKLPHVQCLKIVVCCILSDVFSCLRWRVNLVPIPPPLLQAHWFLEKMNIYIFCMFPNLMFPLLLWIFWYFYHIIEILLTGPNHSSVGVSLWE